MTKRIAPEQRISIPIRKSSKTGRKRTWLAKPRTSLKDKLSNLHLLLRVPSFARWPLEVRFFCEDAYQEWQSEEKRANSRIRSGIKVLLDLTQPEGIINDGQLSTSPKAKGKRKRDALGKGGIEGLDLGYSELKNHVEKSSSSLAGDEALKCAVCSKNLGPKATMALVCPHKDCRIASHMACLATKFIEDEGAAAASVTPISGRCPGCKTELQWIDLIKELSLRARGQKEVVKIMKNHKERKTKQEHSVKDEDQVDLDKGLAGVDVRALDASDESLPDDWYYQDHDDDMVSVMSGHSASSDSAEAASPTRQPLAAPKLPVVIEDSELDDADFSN